MTLTYRERPIDTGASTGNPDGIAHLLPGHRVPDEMHLASIALGASNVGRLSCGEAPGACGHRARRLPQLTIQSAGEICKRRDLVHLGRKEGLQPRER